MAKSSKPPSIEAQKRQRLAIDQRLLNQEIGLCIRSWATLHEMLADMLRFVLKIEYSVSFAMWHSLKSDLSQRELLLAAVKASRDHLEHMVLLSQLPTPFPQIAIYDAIILAINKITEHSHRRNDAAHSPIVFSRSFFNDEDYEAEVSRYTQNPRAAKLKDKELFQYFRWSNACAQEFQLHIRALTKCLYDETPLPEKLQLPPLSQFLTRKQWMNRRKPKQPQPPPRSLRT
jgi:hypothetical protein